mmetsp:Transcript_29752/g.79048  ORF Transcript_29752/g.79048 Transcript_29752/m.79048 type:complete len:385 (+) Transcript_29752:3159-4313(+)
MLTQFALQARLEFWWWTLDALDGPRGCRRERRGELGHVHLASDWVTRQLRNQRDGHARRQRHADGAQRVTCLTCWAFQSHEGVEMFLPRIWNDFHRMDTRCPTDFVLQRQHIHPLPLVFRHHVGTTLVEYSTWDSLDQVIGCEEALAQHRPESVCAVLVASHHHLPCNAQLPCVPNRNLTTILDNEHVRTADHVQRGVSLGIRPEREPIFRGDEQLAEHSRMMPPACCHSVRQPLTPGEDRFNVGKLALRRLRKKVQVVRNHTEHRDAFLEYDLPQCGRVRGRGPDGSTPEGQRYAELPESRRTPVDAGVGQHYWQLDRLKQLAVSSTLMNNHLMRHLNDLCPVRTACKQIAQDLGTHARLHEPFPAKVVHTHNHCVGTGKILL